MSGKQFFRDPGRPGTPGSARHAVYSLCFTLRQALPGAPTAVHGVTTRTLSSVDFLLWPTAFFSSAWSLGASRCCRNEDRSKRRKRRQAKNGRIFVLSVCFCSRSLTAKNAESAKSANGKCLRLLYVPCVLCGSIIPPFFSVQAKGHKGKKGKGPQWVASLATTRRMGALLVRGTAKITHNIGMHGPESWGASQGICERWE